MREWLVEWLGCQSSSRQFLQYRDDVFVVVISKNINPELMLFSLFHCSVFSELTVNFDHFIVEGLWSCFKGMEWFVTHPIWFFEGSKTIIQIPLNDVWLAKNTSFWEGGLSSYGLWVNFGTCLYKQFEYFDAANSCSIMQSGTAYWVCELEVWVVVECGSDEIRRGDRGCKHEESLCWVCQWSVE